VRVCVCVRERGHVPNVPGGKVNILGGHGIGHSKQNLYVHVSYFEWFPRQSYFTVQ
jgi:hypothetical protein